MCLSSVGLFRFRVVVLLLLFLEHKRAKFVNIIASTTQRTENSTPLLQDYVLQDYCPGTPQENTVLASHSWSKISIATVQESCRRIAVEVTQHFE